ncbi:MAG: dipeptidase, partial [Firmicutes bacterium]|nr:dipeptidase [Bacillota bacterium]
ERAGGWISLHDHPIRLPEPMEPATWQRYASEERETVGVEGLRRSGLSAVVYSMLGSDDFDRVLRWAAGVRAFAATTPGFFVAEGGDVLERARRTSAIGLVLALETIGSIGDRLDRVDLLFGAGVRSAGLTYNAPNALGHGLLSPRDEGLTPLGRGVVRRMNELGMLVDLAHVGDRTSLDACEVSARPVVISHAGARALWPSPRMKPDEVIRACAATGGLIGIEAAPHTTLTLAHRTHDIDAVMAHVDHCVELVGPEHVALGPDTMFGDHVGLHRLHPASLPAPHHPWVEYVLGMENPGECHRNAAAWLIRHGYPDEAIAAILGGNVARVVRQVLPPGGTAEGER